MLTAKTSTPSEHLKLLGKLLSELAEPGNSTFTLVLSAGFSRLLFGSL
jgi:hypothetical protein